MTARVTAAHWAAAAEAVTVGPPLERDIVARVAQAIADTEAATAKAAVRDIDFARQLAAGDQ